MIILDYRLKRNSDFEKIFSVGKRSFSKSMTVLYMPSKNLKIGYSVSKKHGNAVTRNRIKRLLRAAVRQEIGKIVGNYHIVLVPKKREEYSYNVFLSDLKNILARENLLGDNK